ncbi:transposase [Lentzea sp. NPDC020367]|uniref:transposase n=1 Tax=Lentzea sp. NPDC020367 TaxID=3364125 RepID=UPI0037A1C018
MLCLTLTVAKRTDDTKGFVVLPRRWVVERTFGWLTRRLTRELSGDPPPARWSQPGQPSSTTA